MNNTFTNKDGGQNIAQGDGAVGKQENVTQEVSGDGNIFSGTGNVYYKCELGVENRSQQQQSGS
jgi:hypothetical protein